MNHQPFPAHLLPEPAQHLVVDGSAAIGCDPAMIGPVTLGSMAAAIGNARTIELQTGWREPCVLWVGVVAPSGSAKSPALAKAIRPLERRDGSNFRAFRSAMAEYEARKGAKPHPNNRDDFPPDDVPSVPICERLVTSDATLEALAVLLQSSPRGVVYVADELAAMLGGLSRYARGGRTSTDEARWLPFYGATTLKMDRKTSAPIRVERAAMSIVGMIQPAIFARVLTDADFDSGLVGRLLLSVPPIPKRVWRRGGGLPEAVEAEYAAMIDRLLALPFDPDAEPLALSLDDDAEREWAGYFDALNADMALSDERTRAMLAKLEGGAARLALVVHLGRWASGERVSESIVDGESMRRGIELARWFGEQAKRLYARMDETEGEQRHRELIGLVGRNGGSLSKRELQQAKRAAYPKAEDAQDALDGLIHDGLGQWVESQPGSMGGRPERRFQLYAHEHNPG